MGKLVIDEDDVGTLKEALDAAWEHADDGEKCEGHGDPEACDNDPDSCTGCQWHNEAERYYALARKLFHYDEDEAKSSSPEGG